ncbi:MAG: membrane dipeptidase, partial [Deltaproteobacteria bacterium]|nr:membrane dipeptidase [Deltaproteobacteria bacterium]
RALANHPRNLPDPMLQAIASKGGVIMLNFYPAYLDQDANEATRAHKLVLRDDLIPLRSRFKLEPAKGARALQAFYAQHPFPSVPLDILLDHFDHAIRVAGPDHVGIGADWDGVPSMPIGMEDVSHLPALTLGLLRRGHSAETVRKVLGENLLRVMSEVEYVARELGYSER